MPLKYSKSQSTESWVLFVVLEILLESNGCLLFFRKKKKQRKPRWGVQQQTELFFFLYGVSFSYFSFFFLYTEKKEKQFLLFFNATEKPSLMNYLSREYITIIFLSLYSILSTTFLCIHYIGFIENVNFLFSFLSKHSNLGLFIVLCLLCASTPLRVYLLKSVFRMVIVFISLFPLVVLFSAWWYSIKWDKIETSVKNENIHV